MNAQPAWLIAPKTKFVRTFLEVQRVFVQTIDLGKTALHVSNVSALKFVARNGFWSWHVSLGLEAFTIPYITFVSKELLCFVFFPWPLSLLGQRTDWVYSNVLQLNKTLPNRNVGHFSEDSACGRLKVVFWGSREHDKFMLMFGWRDPHTFAGGGLPRKWTNYERFVLQKSFL